MLCCVPMPWQTSHWTLLSPPELAALTKPPGLVQPVTWHCTHSGVASFDCLTRVSKAFECAVVRHWSYCGWWQETQASCPRKCGSPGFDPTVSAFFTSCCWVSLRFFALTES